MNPLPIPLSPDVVADTVRYVLVPIGAMVASMLLQRLIKHILCLLKRLEELLSSVNSMAFVILMVYFGVLIYIRFFR